MMLRVYLESECVKSTMYMARICTIDFGKENSALPEDIRDKYVKFCGSKGETMTLCMSMEEMNEIIRAFVAYRDHMLKKEEEVILDQTESP